MTPRNGPLSPPGRATRATSVLGPGPASIGTSCFLTEGGFLESGKNHAHPRVVWETDILKE